MRTYLSASHGKCFKNGKTLVADLWGDGPTGTEFLFHSMLHRRYLEMEHGAGRIVAVCIEDGRGCEPLTGAFKERVDELKEVLFKDFLEGRYKAESKRLRKKQRKPELMQTKRIHRKTTMVRFT
jgi:hypothetical protein